MRRLLQLSLLLLATAAVGACNDSPTEGKKSAGGFEKRTYTVGQQVTFNANANDACANPNNRTGRVAAVTERAVVVADAANPAGGFTDLEYEKFGRDFDTFVWPTITAAFGVPGDVDQNGKVVIFFTRVVNDLTSDNSGQYIGGFFFARDLFPTKSTSQLQACAASNQAEMFYMRVPDPSRSANVWSKEAVQRTTVGVIGHEFQHLISASRRLFIVKTTGQYYNEVTWLNEGLSHIAEELLFYAASGLQPRQNINVETLGSSPRVHSAFNTYQLTNFGRLAKFLEGPEMNAPYGSDDELATRGAAWQFLRYVADQRGETNLWRKLIDADFVGMDNLKNALGAEPGPFFRDWSVSVYTDDAAPTPGQFQQPSWNYRSVVPPIHPEKKFPLRTRDLASGATQTVKLKAGGSSYLRFGVAPGIPAVLRTAVTGTQPAATCQQTLNLQVGQVSAPFTLSNGSHLCVSGAGEYTLVLFYGNLDISAATLDGITVAASNVAPVLGPPNPSLGAFDVGSLTLRPAVAAERDVEFEAGLRARERQLARLLPGGMVRPSYSGSAAATPDKLTLSVVRTK